MMPQALPQDVLPHGEGMQLLRGAGVVVDGWLSYAVSLSPEMSVVECGGTAPAEVGLEMMAQACGMLLATGAHVIESRPRRGVVGAVRGYEYGSEPLRVGEHLRVRVRADLVESELVVCEGELYRGSDGVPAQRARITLIITEDGAL